MEATLRISMNIFLGEKHTPSCNLITEYILNFFGSFWRRVRFRLFLKLLFFLGARCLPDIRLLTTSSPSPLLRNVSRYFRKRC
jgi:hypothetical protein